jgi:hypothetical protein
MLTLALAVFTALIPQSTQSPTRADVDTDGDGLSDFAEIHKYFTDPTKADTDGDGIPDGDWDERREYTYTVRTIVRVLPPITDDVLHDDYQDARVLERKPEYVELEVIHYPLNTVASAITGDPKWRENAKPLEAFTRPGLTANWDEPMRASLVAALAKDGIDEQKLDDKTLVERASKWVFGHAKFVDGFTTYCSWFPKGKAAVYPGLEDAVERGKSEKKLPLEEQWRRELFAKGMFETRVHGTCTSSAIYLSGCLRALGIPTRIVLAIPAVDASQPKQLELVTKGVTHKGVRRTMLQALERSTHGWTSHTFDEVFVGGRWRRLNYDRLGQNILDAGYLGLMTHVDTFDDWADGEMAKTWGVRQARELPANDVFGGMNPYCAVEVSDRFGAHAKIADDWLLGPDEFQTLTIERAYWLGSPECKVEVQPRDSDAGAGLAFVHVREGKAGVGARQYEAFRSNASLAFVLRADGHPDVPARNARGCWAQPEKGIQDFDLRIEPDDLAKMIPAVRYRVVPVQKDDAEFRWNVAGDVFLVRDSKSSSTPKAASANPKDGITFDRALWSDDASLPKQVRESSDKDRPVLFLHVADHKTFAELKTFTQKADLRFALEAEGHNTISSEALVGGTPVGKDVYVALPLGQSDWHELVKGTEYTLRPRNNAAGFHWHVSPSLKIVRH